MDQYNNIICKGWVNMRAIISVIGNDRKGIIAGVSGELAACEVNILDLDQTILQGFFTMMMLVDLADMNVSLEMLIDKLEALGVKLGLSIKLQREDIFNAMHKI
jgi:ACT domain-containing protein